jgi:hypothetical protein
MGVSVNPSDFMKALELNSYMCRRAFSRLWMTGDGRYAYADDWNVLADCVENIFNTIDELYRWWGDLAMFNPHSIIAQKMFQRIRRLYMETFECRRMFARYKRVLWGDIITPEHTNVLIDTAKCLDDAMERSPRRGRVILVDPDDWGTASSFIEDGTIVFANFGTRAMSPADVQYFLENYNVVFAIVIDKGRLGNTGAFYRIFYTEPDVVSRVCIPRSFRLRRGAFYDSYGVSGCSEPRGPDMPIGYLPTYWDCMVSAMYKIPTAVRWTWQYGIHYEYERIHLGGLDIPPGTCVTIHITPWGEQQGTCNASAVLDPKFREQMEIEAENRPSIGADILYSWAYARIGKGAVIELPLSSLLTYNFVERSYMFDWYVGAIAHVLLGEPDKCHIGPIPQKLRNIVWMAGHGTDVYGVPAQVHGVLRNWASDSGWRIIDLRSRQS